MEENNKLYSYGLKLLSLRDRTEKELTEKFIKKGYKEQEIALVIDKLKQLDYLNDYKFALKWVRMRLEQKLLGKERIRQELKSKGISDEIISYCLEEIDQDLVATNIKRLLDKNYPNLDKSDFKQLRRAGNFIQRRGYSVRDFLKVLELTDGVD